MPLSGGTSGAHDDAMHQGNAKRDVVDGLAALDASGFVLAKGAGIAFPRSGSDDVHIYERTSGEEAYAFHRVGADDYTFYIKESNVWKRFQTESMKDVANGIAALNGGGDLLVLGSDIRVARDILGRVRIVERTSAETVFYFIRDGVDDYTAFIHSGGVGAAIQLDNMKDVANGIAGLDANARLVAGQYGVGENRSYHRTKVASANLRNSHDAAVDLTNTVNAVKKTFTFTNGIAGVLRAKMTLYNEVGGETTTGRWYKNGVAFGVVQTESGVMTSTEFSEDLPGMVMQPGDTLEVWAFGTTGVPADHTLSNCRLYYDKESHTGEAAVNS